ncbi:UDP-glucose/GDP-mannose dehydrogenase family protein [Gammaproteobacteria bacterium]|nr:UDP-glucose/GDP-mannose dehydrogenase family protein [Gammaproteobacteria bacterium]
MKITIIGTGYVGLVTGACFADMGHHVICIDNNPVVVRALNKGQMPFFEPNLERLVQKNLKNKRLLITSSYKKGCINEIIFICIDTPSDQNGSPNLKNLFSAVDSIGKHIRSDSLVVTKSTIPLGTNKKILLQLQKLIDPNVNIEICSNPEFLREGSAVRDFMRPDRIIIGSNTDKALGKLTSLYSPLNRKSNKIISMSIESAELVKYAANAFLATKISFINKISQISEKSGANIHDVSYGIGSDSRIGSEFLNAGLGYGGSCFPKDIKALIKEEKMLGIKNSILKKVQQTNDEQYLAFVNKIKSYHGRKLKNKILMIWGLSFKPNTDDIRESIAIKIIQEIAPSVHQLKLYDPQATANASKALKHITNISFINNQYQDIDECHSLVICTDWKEFHNPKLHFLKTLQEKVIFDGRNILDPKKLKGNGFAYLGIGL